MNKEKNHWLALYLTGMYPGYFTTPDKLLFIDELQTISPTTFSDEKIKMFGMFGEVNEYEFYLSFLNKVERNFSDKFFPFLQSLNIPKEVIEQSIKKLFDHDVLLQEFQTVKANTDKTKKGKAFEEFLKKFFDSMDGLEVVDIERQASDQQIDFILKNNVNRPFWINLGSSLLIGEAKNWKDKTPTKEIATLSDKVNDHKNFSCVGVFVAMNGFTEELDETQKRKGSSEKIVLPIQGDDIEMLLTEKQNPIDWLEERIISSFK